MTTKQMYKLRLAILPTIVPYEEPAHIMSRHPATGNQADHCYPRSPSDLIIFSNNNELTERNLENQLVINIETRHSADELKEIIRTDKRVGGYAPKNRDRLEVLTCMNFNKVMTILSTTPELKKYSGNFRRLETLQSR